MRRENQLENGLHLLEVYLFNKGHKAKERGNYSQMGCYYIAYDAVRLIQQGKNDELKRLIEDLDN